MKLQHSDLGVSIVQLDMGSKQDLEKDASLERESSSVPLNRTTTQYAVSKIGGRTERFETLDKGLNVTGKLAHLRCVGPMVQRQ